MSQKLIIVLIREVRVWSADGDTLFTLSGHTSFVYSVAVLPSGQIVSSGEDSTVRILARFLSILLYARMALQTTCYRRRMRSDNCPSCHICMERVDDA